MSPSLIRTIGAFVLLLHGLGHALPALAFFGRPLSESHGTESWLLSGVLGEGPVGWACVLLNLVVLGLFLVAGLAVGGWGLPREIWTFWAGWAAGLSLLGLAVFWHGFPFLFPNKIGVLAVDLFVLLSILRLQWPPSLFHD